VEVEFDARPIPGLSFDGAFSWTDFRFINGIVGSNIVPGVTQAAFVPKWKYALGAQYEIALGGAGSITPRVDWTWQSKMQSNIPNNAPGYELGEVASRGLLNARITYRTDDRNWELALAATNLTDKFYYNNKYDRSSQVGGNAYGMPGRPREFIASVKRTF
jgi:iron complex outermembrane receptor protein